MSAQSRLARRARHVWMAVPLAALLLVAGIVLNRQRSFGFFAEDSAQALVAIGTVVPIMLALVLIGALIAVRRPHNPIGWLLLSAGLLFVTSLTLQGYAFQVIELGRDLPGATIANWLGQWLPVPAYVGAGFVMLLFPDGRLPAPRWRGFARAYALLGAAYSLAFAVAEWPGRRQFVAEIEAAVPYVGDTLVASLWPAFMALLAATVSAVVVRYRRGTAEERAQIRWLAPAGVGIALGPVVYQVQQDFTLVVFLLAGLGGIGFPASIAVAVLRYRLYEIDRIISRTVAYGLVVAVLAGVYAVGVIGFGTLLSAIVGVDGSDLAVAASVLAAVALFRPLRTRVQAVVDRRFNRTGYEARQAVDAFPDRIRDEVDPEAIRGATAATATVALQPTTAWVWLADLAPQGPHHGTAAGASRPDPPPARRA